MVKCRMILRKRAAQYEIGNNSKLRQLHHLQGVADKKIPYILESNPHPFYSFRGLKNQIQIRIAVVNWIFEKW